MNDCYNNFIYIQCIIIHYNWGEPERAPHLPYCCVKSSRYIHLALRRYHNCERSELSIAFNGPDFRYVYIIESVDSISRDERDFH